MASFPGTKTGRIWKKKFKTGVAQTAWSPDGESIVLTVKPVLLEEAHATYLRGGY
jgi:hypothetical protein